MKWLLFGTQCYSAAHRSLCERTFMLSVMTEQPYPEWPPTGLHFNHSLWSTKTNENAMYDSSQADSLSDIARWWVAGLLKHASALMAFCCPTVNCYRRLGGCFAPTYADWAIDDRNATIRVKNYGPKVNYSVVFTVYVLLFMPPSHQTETMKTATMRPENLDERSAVVVKKEKCAVFEYILRIYYVPGNTSLSGSYYV